MNAPFRLGILSTARIAHGFVDGVRDAPGLSVVAVGSPNRTADNASPTTDR